MRNDELQMTKEIRSSKVERRAGVRSAVSSFGFRYSFGFRHSLFGFGNCGSWKAPFRFCACIGLMNRSEGRLLFGVPPSGDPDRLKPGLQTFGSWKAPFHFFACIGIMNRFESPSPGL